MFSILIAIGLIIIYIIYKYQSRKERIIREDNLLKQEREYSNKTQALRKIAEERDKKYGWKSFYRHNFAKNYVSCFKNDIEFLDDGTIKRTREFDPHKFKLVMASNERSNRPLTYKEMQDTIEHLGYWEIDRLNPKMPNDEEVKKMVKEITDVWDEEHKQRVEGKIKHPFKQKII